MTDHDLPETSTELAPPNDMDYWRPGVRLSTRVEAPRARGAEPSSRKAWWAAAVIIVGALIIAVALWLAALWAQNRSDEGSEPTESAAASWMAAGAAQPFVS